MRVISRAETVGQSFRSASFLRYAGLMPERAAGLHGVSPRWPCRRFTPPGRDAWASRPCKSMPVRPRRKGLSQQAVDSPPGGQALHRQISPGRRRRRWKAEPGCTGELGGSYRSPPARSTVPISSGLSCTSCRYYPCVSVILDRRNRRFKKSPSVGAPVPGSSCIRGRCLVQPSLVRSPRRLLAGS